MHVSWCEPILQAHVLLLPMFLCRQARRSSCSNLPQFEVAKQRCLWDSTSRDTVALSLCQQDSADCHRVSVGLFTLKHVEIIIFTSRREVVCYIRIF